MVKRSTLLLGVALSLCCLCAMCNPDHWELSIGTATNGKLDVKNAAMKQEGFVVINEALPDGSPGALVGQSDLLPIGGTGDFSVGFEGTPGKKYIAMIRADNGDGLLNEDADDPAEEGGQSVMQTFTAQ